MTNMSIQPLWLTYFIEILLVLEFQLIKTYFGMFSYKAHFRPQISSNGASDNQIRYLEGLYLNLHLAKLNMMKLLQMSLLMPASKSRKQSRKRNMVDSALIPVEGIVDLGGTPSNKKRRSLSVGAETNVITESESENYGGSR